jgi:2-polyprenyl-3-methyl-5-hydroxy-6-metoxy-1,4-benzoquinol methylase
MNMPHSFPCWIEQAAHKIIREQPRSVLDVGVGFGMAGMLVREYGDVWHLRLDRSQWQVRLDGIEIHQPYIQPHQLHFYNTIWIGNALRWLPELGLYDMVFCMDVLEHFAREDGIRLLNLIAEHGTHLFISTPVKFFAQDAIFENQAERHLDAWTAAELAPYGTVTERGGLYIVER